MLHLLRLHFAAVVGCKRSLKSILLPLSQYHSCDFILLMFGNAPNWRILWLFIGHSALLHHADSFVRISLARVGNNDSGVNAQSRIVDMTLLGCKEIVGDIKHKLDVNWALIIFYFIFNFLIRMCNLLSFQFMRKAYSR